MKNSPIPSYALAQRGSRDRPSFSILRPFVPVFFLPHDERTKSSVLFSFPPLTSALLVGHLIRPPPSVSQTSDLSQPRYLFVMSRRRGFPSFTLAKEDDDLTLSDLPHVGRTQMLLIVSQPCAVSLFSPISPPRYYG